MNDTLTADEAAQQLGLTSDELLHRAYHNEIHCQRLPGQVVFSQTDIDEYKTQMTEPPDIVRS